MAKLNVTFNNGDGTLNIKVYRLGKVVSTVNLNQTGSVDLAVQKSDMVSLGGVCTGTADIKLDVITMPSTPLHDEEGPINHSLRIK